jgi:hypothetical protein
MRLRSGKVMFNECEKAIIFDIKKIINSVEQINLCVDIINEKQIFIEKIHLLSELYYLIEYYDLKNNIKFVKFIESSKEKASEIICYITKEREEDFKLSEQENRDANKLLEFCTTFVNS